MVLVETESEQKQGSISNKTGQNDLITKEQMEEGSISLKVFKALWKESPKLWTLVAIIFTLACFSAAIFSRIILMNWTEVKSEEEGNYYFPLFIISSFMESITLFIAMMALGEIFIQAITGLYKESQIAVLYSPQRFFDTTPIGRILNRFSQDINSLDMQARKMLKILLWQASSMVPGIVGSIIQAPIISIMVIVIGSVLIYLWNFVGPTYHRLKRLESVSRSPIYSYFRETLSGSTCIRTYQAGGRFTREFHKKLDRFGNCSYLMKLTSSWRSLVFSLASCSLYVFIVALGIWNKGLETAAGIGLLLSYAVRVNEMVEFFFSSLTELEVQFISAERLHEFSDLPPEGDRFGKPKSLPEDWPRSGAVEFQDYSASYAKSLSPILNQVNFSIREREKIGIVGRTGAGKSSLTLALYRLIERLQGSIRIDGADISTIGLFHLRSALSIIPQDPVIFSGTLRFNLDPFKKHSDAEIWRCLELAQLKGYFEKFGQGLDYVIEEGGKNLSTGQKQLMCLSRSILTKSKIIVLDEATSSIDMETDSLIQDILRTEFTESTMLIVAHRLNTVIKCDRVMVMDGGKLVEFESPQNLLADESSQFFALAKESQVALVQ